jgi:pimeloyl-ACP methyl ester carboxylesterase
MPDRLTVPSKDGVEISLQKTGSGPALLAIHGAMLNGALSWDPTTGRLAQHFTVYAMDRRGRAPSGDAKEYSIDREAEDVEAVLAAIGAPTIVLSHSYGALVTLDALDRMKNVSHLILYEPPVVLEPIESDRVARMERALAAGDRAEVVTTFLRDQVRVPADRIAAMQTSPIWPIILDISPTLPRESKTVNTHRLSAERLANSKIRTTVLLGSLSVGLLREAAFFVVNSIPGAKMVVLEKQGHGAMLEAPDWFADKIVEIAK